MRIPNHLRFMALLGLDLVSVRYRGGRQIQTATLPVLWLKHLPHTHLPWQDKQTNSFLSPWHRDVGDTIIEWTPLTPGITEWRDNMRRAKEEA